MLTGRRIAILAEEDFDDSQLIEPVRAMKNAGAKVVIVGSGSQNVYQGQRGIATVYVDIDADKVMIENFDAVIVPGGYAVDRMRTYEAMVDIVRRVHNLGKVIAAICHGPQVLITADIVRGFRVTSWPSIAVDLKNAGAEWVNEPVVKDRNIITARKPADLPRFNKTIIEALRS